MWLLHFQRLKDKLHAAWRTADFLIKPYHRKGEGDRPVYPLLAMLRAHLVQNWFGYSDPAMEGALYQTTIVRQFSGLHLDQDAAPRHGGRFSGHIESTQTRCLDRGLTAAVKHRVVMRWWIRCWLALHPSKKPTLCGRCR